jgi:hypothetical protein
MIYSARQTAWQSQVELIAPGKNRLQKIVFINAGLL